MKRILLSFALMILFVAASAQTNNEHLTFKGVPINGSLNEYVAKMKSAGFTFMGKENGTALLQGDFAGFKGCFIVVSTLNTSDIVNTIGVVFPGGDDWSSLEKNYTSLKDLLTTKYGKPEECVEEFQYYKTPEDNSTKLHCLQMDKCTYFTTFETPKGSIRLSLDHQDMNGCFVKLQYWDKINTDAIKAKAIDDL